MTKLEKLRARLTQISASLKGMVGAESYTQEQIDQVNALNDEFEQITAQIATEEKIEAIQAKVGGSSGRKVSAAAPANKVGEQQTPAPNAKLYGFETAGTWLQAVAKAGSHGFRDDRLKAAVAMEKNGEDGGFMVPEEISTEITKKMGGDQSLLARTRQRLVAGNALSIMVNETQPWNGGVTAYWTAEGAPIGTSKPKFAQAHFRLHKLAALVPVTDELLEDAPALESHIKDEAPAAIMWKVNSAIIAGNGTGKPKGILSSPFKVTVAKESGQAADTIVADNIIKMFSRMLPDSIPNAVWFVNAGAAEALRGMKDADGNYIYLSPGSALNQSPYALLMGRPVIPMLGSLPALGDEGDLVFADLSYYYSIVKAGGVKSAVSTHLYFDKDETAFRFTFRVDGQVPFKSPVTTEYGNYEMSAIVTLADRA